MPELNTELALLSAEQVLDGYARQDFSPVDVLQAVFERVARFNGGINAFAAMAPGALAEAGRSAGRWRAGRPIGALDGVPCTVADLLDVAGLPTRHGSRLSDATPAADDAPAVMGLRAAGAVVIGKTTTAEFGWKVAGDCPLHGITRNPWDTTRTASAGAGAAGAACFGPLHLGVDARIPAAWCGLVGLKPSFGRVPHWPPGPLAGIGAVTHTVGDCALVLSAIARADRRDPFCLPDDCRDWRDGLDRGVAGLRIAVLRQPGFDAPADVAAISAVEEAAGILLDAGAILEQVTPELPDIRPAFGRRREIGLARLVASVPEADRSRLDRGLVEAAAAAAAMPASDLAAAEAVRMEVAHAMAGLHARFDLCLCPTVPAGPIPANAPLPDPDGASWQDWTALFSLSHQPALTVPMPPGPDGMPRSVQFAAALRRDDLVLRAGWAIEQAGAFASAPLDR